jgi:hypothetical protein
MTIQISREGLRGALLPLFIASDCQECIVDLQPRSDGVKFIRGILMGIILCVPIWLLIWWALARYF